MLAGNARPLSADALHQEIRAVDAAVHASAVFRALNRLLAAGLVDRVELGTRYVGRRPPGTITLCCSGCGSYAEAPGAPIEALALMAQSQSFTPSRFVVEVAGLCSACGTPGRPTPTSVAA